MLFYLQKYKLKNRGVEFVSAGTISVFIFFLLLVCILGCSGIVLVCSLFV